MARRTSWLGKPLLVIACPLFALAQTSAPPPTPSPQIPAAEAASIHLAAMQGDLATVKKLLADKPALLEAVDDEEGATPLAFAAVRSQMEVMGFLLDRGADVNAPGSRGLSPLLGAVALNQVQAARLLLERGADPGAKGPSGMRPLHFAAGESPEIVGLLVQRKPNLEVRDDYGNTPLILAARAGAGEAVRLLVEAGADVNAVNPFTGDGPLDVAAAEGHAKVADYLRGKGAKTRSEPRKPLRGPYLGQTPPGGTPAVFAPNLVSTEAGELNSVFSPDGREFYFTRQRRVHVVREENGAWGRPQPLAIFGDYRSVDMFVTRDNARMYVCSNRPPGGKGEAKKDHDIWVVTRAAGGWSDPTNLGETINSNADDYYPTLTAAGDLSFSSRREGGKGRNDVYRARFVDGKFERPENLGAPINTPNAEFDPFVAPDGSYLIFASDRPGGLGSADLYIAFRGKGGSWSEPRNLGAPVNTPYLEYAPMLSPDGKYLFFTSGRGGADDIYWVDARVIDALRPPR